MVLVVALVFLQVLVGYPLAVDEGSQQEAVKAETGHAGGRSGSWGRHRSGGFLPRWPEVDAGRFVLFELGPHLLPVRDDVLPFALQAEEQSAGLARRTEARVWPHFAVEQADFVLVALHVGQDAPHHLETIPLDAGLAAALFLADGDAVVPAHGDLSVGMRGGFVPSIFALPARRAGGVNRWDGSVFGKAAVRADLFPAFVPEQRAVLQAKRARAVPVGLFLPCLFGFQRQDPAEMAAVPVVKRFGRRVPFAGKGPYIVIGRRVGPECLHREAAVFRLRTDLQEEGPGSGPLHPLPFAGQQRGRGGAVLGLGVRLRVVLQCFKDRVIGRLARRRIFHNLGPAALPGAFPRMPQSVVAVVVLQAFVRARIQKGRHDLGTAENRRLHERRGAVPAAGVCIRARLQKRSDHLDVIVTLRCPGKRRAAVVSVAGIHLRARGQQRLYHGQVVRVARRLTKRCGTVAVPDVCVCSCSQQRPHHTDIASVLRSLHKGGFAVPVPAVDIGAGLQKRLHHDNSLRILAVAHCRHTQGSETIRVPGFGVGAVFQLLKDLSRRARFAQNDKVRIRHGGVCEDWQAERRQSESAAAEWGGEQDCHGVFSFRVWNCQVYPDKVSPEVLYKIVSIPIFWGCMPHFS